VRDAKTGEDLTRSILLQIILEERRRRAHVQHPLLAQIIRFYGHAMQGVMGGYWRRRCRPSPTCSRPSPSSPPEHGLQPRHVDGLMGGYAEQSRR
jgi:hypothetical protein